MCKYSNEFLERTIKVWQPYSPVPLSLEDAREILENMTGLFLFLLELEKKYGKEEKKI
jgi:hypothetical protein